MSLSFARAVSSETTELIVLNGITAVDTSDAGSPPLNLAVLLVRGFAVFTTLVDCTLLVSPGPPIMDVSETAPGGFRESLLKTGVSVEVSKAVGSTLGQVFDSSIAGSDFEVSDEDGRILIEESSIELWDDMAGEVTSI